MDTDFDAEHVCFQEQTGTEVGFFHFREEDECRQLLSRHP
jgi:hypothetical protein